MTLGTLGLQKRSDPEACREFLLIRAKLSAPRTKRFPKSPLFRIGLELLSLSTFAVAVGLLGPGVIPRVCILVEPFAARSIPGVVSETGLVLVFATKTDRSNTSFRLEIRLSLAEIEI